MARLSITGLIAKRKKIKKVYTPPYSSRDIPEELKYLIPLARKDPYIHSALHNYTRGTFNSIEQFNQALIKALSSAYNNLHEEFTKWRMNVPVVYKLEKGEIDAEEASYSQRD